ncbi:MAG: hypothetical protein ACRD4O_03245, partial [Bryobacteraceae bacterium]
LACYMRSILGFHNLQIASITPLQLRNEGVLRDKRAKFVELATKRVNAAIKDLRLIGNLGNRSNYDYTEDDVRKIVRALQRELDTVRARFSETSSGADTTFQL